VSARRPPRVEAKPAIGAHDLERDRVERAPLASFSFRGVPVQAKARLGACGDAWETEADALAAAVLRMPAPVPEKPKPAGSAPAVQRKAMPAREPLEDRALSASLEALRGGGEPLSHAVRSFFEPRFGFDFSRVRIHTDARAASAADALGARAFTAGEHIAFAGGEFQPDAAAGRTLLAHELAHTIQQGVARPLGMRSPRVVQPPSQRTAPELQRDEREKPPEKLPAVVQSSRADELKQIKELLSKTIITDGNVEDILRILEVLDDSVIVALMSSLEPGMLSDYVDNLHATHVKWRREVLASLHACATNEETDPDGLLRKLDTGVVEAMNITDLRFREYQALVFILRSLNANAPKKLKHIFESKHGSDFEKMLRSPRDFSKAERENADAAAKAAALEEGKLKEEYEAYGGVALPADKQPTKSDDFEGLVKAMTDLLEHKEEEAARRVLDLFADGYRREPPAIRALARRLDQAQVLDQFIQQLPSEEWSPEVAEGKRFGVFMAVIGARQPERNFKLVEKLLSTGSLGRVPATSLEAQLAYYIIKQMPLRAQDAFRRRDGGEWLQRMEEHLDPEFVLTRFEGLEVQQAAGDRERFESTTATFDKGEARFQGLALFRGLLPLIKRKLTKESAREMFAMLANAATVEPDAAKVAVRRLDAVGYVDEVFKALGHDFLLAEENRRAATHLLLARDPIILAAHARKLAKAVYTTQDEAELAWLYVKALPAAERTLFENEDRGKWWGVIEDNIGPRLKRSAQNTPYEGGEKFEDEHRLVDMLLDDANWTPASSERLQGVLRMARIAGLGRRAFEESRRRYDHEDLRKQYLQLQATIERYKLYWPGREKFETEEEEKRPELAWYQKAGRGFLFVMKALFGRDIQISGQLRVMNLDLAEVQDLAGGPIGGVTFVGRDELDRNKTAVSAKGLEQANKVRDLSADPKTGTIEGDLPDVRFSNITVNKGSAGLRAGVANLTGVKLTVRVPAEENQRHPYLRISAEAVDVSELTYVKRDSMVAINHLGLLPKMGPEAFSLEIHAPGTKLEDYPGLREGQETIGIRSPTGSGLPTSPASATPSRARSTSRRRWRPRSGSAG
jgi:hypothetical protein